MREHFKTKKIVPKIRLQIPFSYYETGEQRRCVRGLFILFNSLLPIFSHPSLSPSALFPSLSVFINIYLYNIYLYLSTYLYAQCTFRGLEYYVRCVQMFMFDSILQ